MRSGICEEYSDYSKTPGRGNLEKEDRSMRVREGLKNKLN